MSGRLCRSRLTKSAYNRDTPWEPVRPEQIDALLSSVERGLSLREASQQLGAPKLSTVYKKRNADITFSNRLAEVCRPAAPYQPTDFNHVLKLVAEGASLKTLCLLNVPTARTVRKFAQANPDFRRRLDTAFQQRHRAGAARHLRRGVSREETCSALRPWPPNRPYP